MNETKSCDTIEIFASTSLEYEATANGTIMRSKSANHVRRNKPKETKRHPANLQMAIIERKCTK